ncbi:S8 family peptidase [Mesonia maritima]|uniref:S8 family peptidase n=1 Tax=Mesonia maritima TaxID=1793873 RepID=UPI003644126B
MISNHSYGTPVSESPAWYMGAYSSASRSWDQITRTEQYLLTVIAAGNDGNVTNPSPLQTGYDKLTGNAVSKNNLVVANAFDAPIGQSTGTIIGEVNINPSSSQGPTDDGRIKPDITGNGTDLLSTANFSNSSYDKSSGTSMASPNVAGTLILLQQYYNRLNGNFMYASTLKGLACHTADDILIDGPDAISGWGLLNALKAANTITKDFSGNGSSIIQENTMTNSNILEFEVQASGTENLEATICWTDIPGTATTSLNSNTPALVNDLDIRIIKNSNNTEYFPWKLNLANLNSPAIKGDNNVDNVEKVSVDNANGGDTYTIRVSHKGNLTGGFQTYSLIVTGIDATASTIGSKKNQFSIWPNPADNSVNFTSPNGFTDATIEIYDLNGRIVKTFNDINTSKTFSGDLTGMAAGVYVAKLNDGINGTIQKRIIKK